MKSLGIFSTVARTELKEKVKDVSDDTLWYLNYAIRQAYEMGVAVAKEKAAMKEEMPRYRHFKGSEYTVLHDDVLDSDVGPDAMPDVVYIGKDGVKWRRPATEFYGYKGTDRRFTPIKKEN